MPIQYDYKQDAFYKKGKERGIVEGMEKGLEKGLEEGRVQERRKGILALLQDGSMSIPKIAMIFNVTEEYVVKVYEEFEGFQEESSEK